MERSIEYTTEVHGDKMLLVSSAVTINGSDYKCGDKYRKRKSVSLYSILIILT